MTITITTSNVNGIRAAKRKGIEDWAGKHAPDVWCIQEVRAPQDDVDNYSCCGVWDGPRKSSIFGCCPTEYVIPRM
jgi:hypothetical protein